MILLLFAGKADRKTSFHFMKLLLYVFLLLSNLVLSQVNLNNGLIAHYPFTGNANSAYYLNGTNS